MIEPHLDRRVSVWTMLFDAVVLQVTQLHSVIIHMKQRLLATMAHLALMAIRTTILIIYYRHFVFPVGTSQLGVFQICRSSSKVVPVMCVNTFIFLVFVDERTPNCFEIKTVEVSVLWLH